MKIGIDVDDVLAMLNQSLIDFHNEKYGTNYMFSDFTNYQMENVWGGNLEDALNEIKEFIKKSKYDLMPIKGSIEAIKKLKKNNELYIITSRAKEYEKFTHDWLNKHFPQTFKEVHFSNNFFNNGNKLHKNEICDILSLDIMIEDSLEHATRCATNNRKLFLLDKPWNQTKELPKNVIRVNSWPEVLQKIDAMQFNEKP